ncbi:MAG TPA: glycosyltransferase, partial [Opitutaceae bacterium]|nr:glycosyltransferase [Opitutaceae bacterium]
MARVRIILLTFRRPALLPRAIESLRRQTFADWVCELHNGDPTDPDPGHLLAKLGDPRIQLVLPPRRTGPVEAFNLAHRPVPEEYQSLLEDDNWWEPIFLEKMIASLDAHPEVDLAWSNMRVWRELPGNQWKNTGDCVWSPEHWPRPRLFSWPQLLHVSDILYSNGAMLLRSPAAGRLIMPADTPRDMIEHTRERMMRYPILFVPEPLANFALTLLTFRSTDYTGWS